jgi:hypothetical protein
METIIEEDNEGRFLHLGRENKALSPLKEETEMKKLGNSI